MQHLGNQVRYIIKEAKEPDCCCSSIAKLYLTLCDPMGCSTPGFPVLHYLSEFYSNLWSLSLAIQSSHPMSSPSLPAFYFSQPQGLCQWAGPLHQVAKLLELQLQHQSFQWIFRVDCLRIDWFDLLLSLKTLKSLLQSHSLKVSILQHSTLFIVQLWHPYMTTGKIIALTRRTFVG